MKRLKKFFLASARDLKMKQLTLHEITAKMQKADENSLRLPRAFARTVSLILQENDRFDNNIFQRSTKKRAR
jgi:hypothetical protein